MPIDPDQLLDLARAEAALSQPGAPRQVELRRAVSTACYALFHALCGDAAKSFSRQRDCIYRMFYRSLQHRELKERCKKLARQPLPESERLFFRRDEFELGLRGFAATFVTLQESRHSCDYDPSYRISREGALAEVENAAEALQGLRNAGNEQRLDFLAYMLFGLR